MKSDPDVQILRSDSVVLATKATELFIDYLTKESYQFTKNSGRKTLQYDDIAETVNQSDEFSFLEDIIIKRTKGSQIKKLLAKDS